LIKENVKREKGERKKNLIMGLEVPITDN